MPSKEAQERYNHSEKGRATRRAAMKRYVKTDRGKAMKSAADARYYKKNAEKIGARVKARYDSLTPEQRHFERNAGLDLENKKKLNVDSNVKLKIEVLSAYGGVCACCGNAYLPHLTLDHINGGGAEERRALGGGRAVYRRLRREEFPPGYQVLCFNCNIAKLHLGECGCQVTLRLVEGGGA